mgnify:CR=1 FL=1|jgi:hypothetical protein
MNKLFGFLDLLVLGLFLVLFNNKINGGDISWWVVFSPALVYIAVFLVMFVLGILLFFVGKGIEKSD